MPRSHQSNLNISRRGLIKAGIGSAAALGLGARASRSVRAAQSGDPIVIGMSAAFSGPNASTGEAQLRGAQMAIDEINAAGGVLDRPLSIVTRDNVHEQDKGVLQTRELIEKEGAVGILGSAGSFIAIAVADTMEELEVPWIGLSTGAAAIIDNGQDPNWMYRVSSNDPWVAEFLVRWSVEKLNMQKIGILNEDTGWGVPAIDDVTAALANVGLEPTSVDKVKVGDTDFTAQMLRAKDAGTEAIVTFTNSVEMANALKAGQKLGYQPRIVSAWGLQNPNYITLAPELGQGTLVMQTYTWVNAEEPKALDLLKRYTENWGITNPAEIPNPSYTADAYDATHLFALAIETAGEANGAAMRDALEQLPEYDGLIKNYAPAFTPERHDALTPDDYLMCEWKGDELVPLGTLGA
jgi:branched-chain amino acid transport system substrate-binding protein